MRGLLIAIEGIDGAGTTTQARELVSWLGERGAPARLTCEPSAGPVGQLLRLVLRRELDHELDPAAVALLFAADRVDHLRHEVQPLLARGVHVVSDRYLGSSLAYQSIGLELAWVAEINREAPPADLAIYVRTPPAVAAGRRQARGGSAELYDAIALQSRISAKYDLIFGSSANDGSWILDPPGSSWIRQDPPGSRPWSRVAQALAVVDGVLAVEPLAALLRKLVEKVAHIGGG